MTAPPGSSGVDSPTGVGRALAFSLLAVLIWGAQLPIAKGIFPALDGYTIALVRYAIAVAAFIPMLWWYEGVNAFSLTSGRIGQVLLAGVLMGASGVLTMAGLAHTRPEVAVLILSLQPAMTALADWMIWRRRPPAITLICLVLAFTGVAIAVTRGGSLLFDPRPAGRGEALGNLVMLGAAISWVGYVLLSSRLQGWSTIRISTLTSGPALLLIVACWFGARQMGWTYLEPVHLPSALWRLAYVSVFGVVVAMFLWNSGALRIGAVNAVLLLNLMPIITFVVRGLEGAQFAPSEIVGAVVVVGALAANNLYLRRRDVATSSRSAT